jgi:ATP-dependent Clp protease, protease subunit
VFLGGELDETVANLIIAQLLHLEGEDMDRPVNLYINSPGGDMTALFAVYDAMQFLGPPIHTVCVGQAASAAAVLLAAGEAGHRAALPNARILIHQPHGGAQGQSVDMEIAVREMVTMRERMIDVLTERTGQPRDRIQADIDRDFILRGQDAVDYGLVDEIIERRKPRAVPALRPPEVAATA